LPRPAFLQSDFEFIKKRLEENSVINDDYTYLSRRALLNHLEAERQEWLAAGMCDTDIHRVHFGSDDENGRGGDYGVWLADRRRVRDDHKYAPGTPVALDTVDPDGVWLSSGHGGIDDVEFNIELESALSLLTPLQRVSFIEVRLNGRTQADVADELGVLRECVKQAIAGALKKLKKYFS
jgi:RNA polymerase sigma factor (sigma-70 family)